MKKIYTITATYHAYNVPYTRQAQVYESETPVFKGCLFEVSTHTGGPAAEWEFKPFRTIEDAQAYAIGYVSPSHIECKPKQKD